MPRVAAPPQEPVNILLVDDEPKNLRALESILAADDRRLMTAQSGEDALRWLLKERFAVVLLDVHMPEMDGFETASLIRHHVRSSATPIIFLTAANKEDAHVLRGYSLGAVDYIFKPLDVGILRSKVAVFVDLFRKSEQVRRQAELLREARGFLQNILESTTDYAIIAQGLDGTIAAWYEGAREHYGYSADEMVGRRSSAILFDPADVESGAVQGLLDAARSTGRAEGVFEQARREGSRFTASVTVNVQRDAEGAVIGYVLIAKDVTERQLQEQRFRLLLQEQAARAEAEAANRRFALLAAASDALSHLFDNDLALHAFARLTASDMAEACLIGLLSDAGEVEQTIVAAREPDIEGRLEALAAPELIRPALARIVARGQPLLFELSAEAPGDAGLEARLHHALHSLDMTSALTVPIPGQHRAWGALWLLRIRQEPYDRRDLDVAADLVRRVGLALDNARLYQQAQEAVRIREEFLSVASHELRTPITSLRGHAQLLIRQLELGRAPDQARLTRGLRIIDDQSHKLARLVSQLLDISRLQIGKLTLEPSACDIAELVGEVVAHIQATTSRPIELHRPAAAAGEVDALRVEQIVTNLVDNALKYSPAERGVEVEVVQPTAGSVQVAVR
ncbi:MAG: response regulator, partial [Chloroflexi bacterium]|nr:response regulator [Chloroflexota bacterium]